MVTRPSVASVLQPQSCPPSGMTLPAQKSDRREPGQHPRADGRGSWGTRANLRCPLRADCPASAWAPSPAGHESAPPSAPPTTPCPTSANPAHVAIAFCRPLSGETRWGTLHMTRCQRASGQHGCAPRTEANGSSSRAPFSAGRKPAGGPPPRDAAAQLGLPLAGAGGLNVCQGERGQWERCPKDTPRSPRPTCSGASPRLLSTIYDRPTAGTGRARLQAPCQTGPAAPP